MIELEIDRWLVWIVWQSADIPALKRHPSWWMNDVALGLVGHQFWNIMAEIRDGSPRYGGPESFQAYMTTMFSNAWLANDDGRVRLPVNRLWSAS